MAFEDDVGPELDGKVARLGESVVAVVYKKFRVTFIYDELNKDIYSD